MKLKFNIDYNTAWGQGLHVVITYTDSDGRRRTQDLPMNTADGATWTVETVLMESRRSPVVSFVYHYLVADADGRVLRREWQQVERVYAADSTKHYVFDDVWRDIPLQHHLYTDAYLTTTGTGPLRRARPERLPLYRKTVVFRVAAPQLGPGETLALCGNHPAMGSWSPSRYLPMTSIGQYEWMLSVNVDGMALPLEYKYVIVDEATHTLKAWEEGDNRTTGGLQEVADGQVLVLYGPTLRVREATWRVAGVVVPLFSLRSEHSWGVGDFGDLRRMVDWAVATGMKMIQLLPVNDTTCTHGWTDSHPYDIVSAFALHPHYMDMEQLGELRNADRMTVYRRQRRELNALAHCDYLAVHRVKAEYVREMFEQEGERVLGTEAFKAFFAENRKWLEPYAAFCVLRDRHHTARYADWPQWARFDRDEVGRFCRTESEVRLVFYEQYQLWRQFSAAASYARSKGVALKGDLPIGVCRDSVETWMYPQFFHLDCQTGTPPDRYMPNGQNWGFPTYDWQGTVPGSDANAEFTIGEWFAERFRWMGQFFDAFRMDHVVGFFRIWEIPGHALHASLGHFAPALPMSEAEIGQVGLPFRRELMTRPFVNDKVLDKFFGLHASFVKEHFLEAQAYGLYQLKPEFSTQQAIARAFDGKTDENSLWIKDGLLRLAQNVLFMEDQRQPGMYHPRFAAYNEPVYEILNAEEKDAFMRLYNSYYYERHNAFWGSHGYRVLGSLLGQTSMLACAEDLGMLPQCVQPTLEALRVLTLEIQDMPKQHGFEFAHLDAYPCNSVATFSTHDMPPMRLWWEENPGRAQRFFTTMLQKQGRAPQALTSALAEEIVARHLYCPSRLCLLSLQDWLALDNNIKKRNAREERINMPEDSFNQWSYRMHVGIEELMRATQLNGKLKTMIERSKR